MSCAGDNPKLLASHRSWWEAKGFEGGKDGPGPDAASPGRMLTQQETAGVHTGTIIQQLHP